MKSKQLNQQQYKELAPQWLSEHPRCERCGRRSQEIHHKKGRKYSEDGIPLVLHTKYFMAVCVPCHRYIHANPAESYENEWLIYKHRKVAA